jgi:uncharacterized protein (DUF1778 family)
METAMTQPHPFVTQLRINQQQRRFLQLAAITEGRSLSEVMRELIDAAIAEQPKKFRAQLELAEDDFTELLIP